MMMWLSIYLGHTGQNVHLLKNMFRRLRHLPLVDRRSRDACQSSSMWPELHVLNSTILVTDRWQSFVRWLAIRGSMLHTFKLKENRTVIPDLIP